MGGFADAGRLLGIAEPDDIVSSSGSLSTMLIVAVLDVPSE